MKSLHLGTYLMLKVLDSICCGVIAAIGTYVLQASDIDVTVLVVRIVAFCFSGTNWTTWYVHIHAQVVSCYRCELVAKKQ